MDKLLYKIVLIICLAALCLLGPALSSDVMAEKGWANVPKSYLYILLVWIGIIVLSGFFIQKSKW